MELDFRTIDLLPCGMTPDGALVYGGPAEAAVFQIARGIDWLIRKHGGTLRSLALTTAAGLCLGYVLYD